MRNESFHLDVIRAQMETRMNNFRSWIVLGLVSLLIYGCGKDRIYEQYNSIEKEGWKMTDSLVFDLDKVQKLTDPVIQIGVKYSEEYPFSNLYLRIISKDSLESSLENKLINVPLFDSKSGKPLGKGFGNSYTKLDSLPFLLPDGTRQVLVYQYMRENQLRGIESIGIKISKSLQ